MTLCACGHPIESHMDDLSGHVEGCLECGCVYFEADDEESA